MQQPSHNRLTKLGVQKQLETSENAMNDLKIKKSET